MFFLGMVGRPRFFYFIGVCLMLAINIFGVAFGVQFVCV